MRPAMLIRLLIRLLIPLLIPLLLLLAGCGGAGQAGAASPSPSDRLAPYRAAAECIRQHGVPNFPDPVLDAQGNVRMPDAQDPPQSAMNACRTLVDRLREDGRRGPEFTAEEIAQLRRLARCFREHTVTDWPDPDAQGTFHLSRRLYELGKRAWLPARNACLPFFPKGHGLMVEGPPGTGDKK